MNKKIKKKQQKNIYKYLFYEFNNFTVLNYQKLIIDYFSYHLIIFLNINV